MAIRRMLSKKIVDTDAFMDMPLSTQALYMHLVLNADDDGFVGSPRKVIRGIGCNVDDMKILEAKRFVLGFESGVIVIKHWKIHNLIRLDRYTETTYLKEKSILIESDNKAYTLKQPNKGLIVDVIPNDNQMAPQVSIGKGSLEEVRLDYNTVVEEWNSLPFKSIRTLTDKRKKHIKARVNDYGLEQVLETIKSLESIQFFNDNKDSNWFDFDWVFNPNNFVKIIEGKYKGNKSNESFKPDWLDNAMSDL